MLGSEKMARLNELGRKHKKNQLTAEEAAERKELHQEYLAKFRSGMKQHIEGMKIVDESGDDVTPDKLKAIQKEKQIHDRHLED